MGYQHRARSPKRAIREYKRSPYERKNGKSSQRQAGRPPKERRLLTEKQLSELTLKQLHTLGNQRFGSSPFSDHFDRWLMNVELVINEFKAHPTISVDDQFVTECTQALDAIKLQLENLHHKEALIDQETKKLSAQRKLLEQIDTEYLSGSSRIRAQKNAQIKRLNIQIESLKKEQHRIIRLKTGFFRGISPRERERKELEIGEEINGLQRDAELVMLDFNTQLKTLRGEYDRKRDPVLEQIKQCKKTIGNIETDDSLEERWFACEALIDAVNSFLQRKAAAQSH